MPHKTSLDETITRCPECGSTNLLIDSRTGEVSCKNCGVVIVQKTYDFGPEWHDFEGEKDKLRARVGAPITLSIHDKGLSTKIGIYDGKFSSKEQVENVKLLNKWDKRTKIMSSESRALSKILQELNIIGVTLGVPNSVIETASMYVRKIFRSDMPRARSLKGIAAAALYLSCKQCNIVRLLSEVSKAANVPKKEVGKCYRLIIRSLNMSSNLSDVRLYISRFVNNLNLGREVENLANLIYEVAKNARITSGKGPISLAAASTYVAAILLNYNITQREVAETAHVTEVTIRNRYKELLEKLDIEAVF
ncbi:MAG: TFIIB-type zinc ribbon-containing protein [Nitrososphaerota archaeon]